MRAGARRSSRLALAAVTLAGIGAACRLAGRETAHVVARVGERPVDFAQFESFVSANAGVEWAVLEEEVLALLFEQFLDELLLARLAADRGLVDASAGRAEALRALHELVAVERVGEAELQEYLDAHPSARLRPERLVLGQLLIEDRALAEKAQETLRRGRPFEVVAEELAGLPGVVYGGYEQDVTRGDLPLAFRDVLFSLPAGEVTGILEAEYGYHIFHVRERRPDETLSATEAAAAVRRELGRLRTDARLQELLEEARRLYRVEVLDRNLPFDRNVEGGPDDFAP